MAEISEKELDAFVILNASGLRPQQQVALVDAFGTAEAVVGSTDDQLCALDGIDSRHCERLRDAQSGTDTEDMRKECDELNTRRIPYTAEEYPRLLTQTSGFPAMLFVQGQLQKKDELSIAVVGTRKCTPYGLNMARRVAEGLAHRGFTIVSGMAVGIDAEAHRGALEAGKRTIALMASGPDITYPRQHKELRGRIAASGAVITEFAFGTPPTRERFPARNRLISGLSLGTVVVEAPSKSGALITARHAGEQGRDVFAVPGDVTRAESRGAHALIKDGAMLVETAEDVVEGLGMMLHEMPERRRVPTEDLPAEEKTVLEALSAQPTHLDEIISRCKLPASKVTSSLMILEMKGLVRRLPGSTFVQA